MKRNHRFPDWKRRHTLGSIANGRRACWTADVDDPDNPYDKRIDVATPSAPILDNYRSGLPRRLLVAASGAGDRVEEYDRLYWVAPRGEISGLGGSRSTNFGSRRP